MLREDVAADLRDRKQEGPRLVPAYEDYCFGNVPGTLTSALGVPTGRRRLPDDVYGGVDGVTVDEERDVDYVVVFLVDGFELAQWRDHRDHPVVSAVEQSTTVTPLTSVFPSETAAAITTFNTGAYPAEHGVLGWNVYDPELDASFLGLGFDGKAGASVSEHDVATANAVDAADDPAYVYAYLPHVDHEGHATGTASSEYATVVDETWRAVGDAVGAVQDAVGADGDVLVAFAADHGHVDTDPERNVDLGTYPTVVGGLERYDCDGSPVSRSGSPRNVELHVREDAVADVRHVLESDVGAHVIDGSAALSDGLFGDGPVAVETERRVGDLIALHPELGAWFGGDVESEELRIVGMHGGLHPDEMLVPFAAGRLNEVATALQ